MILFFYKMRKKIEIMIFIQIKHLFV